MTLSVLLCPAYSKNPYQSASSRMQSARPVRITTGSVEIKGWEHGLVEKSPNLARWHWDALYGNTQTYTMRSPNPGSIVTHYVKPTHVPTSTRPQYHYLKPIHVPFNLPDKQRETKDVLAQHTMDNDSPLRPSVSTAIKLKDHPQSIDKQVNGLLQPGAKETTATYAKIYDKEVTVAHSSSTASVHGQLKPRANAKIYDKEIGSSHRRSTAIVQGQLKAKLAH